jgi:chromosome partitioning protein
VPRTSALQHAAHLSPVERSYVAKYPGDSGTAIRALCQELLTRLAAANAKPASPSPPPADPPAASVESEAP